MSSQSIYDFNKDKKDFLAIIIVLNDIFGRVKEGSPYKLTHNMLNHLRSQSGTTNKSILSFYRLLYAYLKRATDYSIERGNEDHPITIEFGGEELTMTFGEWKIFYIDDNLAKFDRRIKSYANLILEDMINDMENKDDSLSEIEDFIKKYLKDPRSVKILNEIKSFKSSGSNFDEFKEKLKIIKG